MAKIKLITILGTDRSGSTLLDRIISSNPGMFSVGEVHRFINYYTENYPCTCGAPFLQCEFWRGVLKRLDETAFKPEYLSILGWRKRIKILLQAIIFHPKFLSKKYKKYSESYALFLKSVLADTKAHYIVDSCKDATRAYLLHHSGLFDIFPLYISRAVEDYIISSKKPQMRLDVNRKVGPFKATLRWIFRNTETRCLISSLDARYIQISYQGLVSRPVAVMKKISERLSYPLKYDPEMLRKAEYHFLGGNVTKFRQFTGIHPEKKTISGALDSKLASSVSRKLNRFFVRDNI